MTYVYGIHLALVTAALMLLITIFLGDDEK